MRLVEQLDGDDRRHAAAMREVAAGYARAVAILSPGEGEAAHVKLAWFEAGLADARELAGLPRLRPLPSCGGDA